MRINRFNKSDWAKLDSALRPFIKKTLKLPKKASNEYLYGDTSYGLFGIPLTSDDCDIARVDTAFKLLTSPDPRVADTAWADLHQVTATRARCQVTPSVMEDYLSDCSFEGRSGDSSSLWSLARTSSGKLNIKWNLSAAPNVSITIGDKSITNRRSIFKELRSYLRKNLATALGAKPSQGKTLSCFSKDKASTHFHRTGDFLRFADWRFIHQARLCCVDLKGYNEKLDDTQNRCRVCKDFKETLPHVINNCRPELHRGTRRHNKIVKRIKDAARNWRVLSENQFIADSGLKPDLVLANGDELIILDVACPFDNGYNKFLAKRKEKIDKYLPLKEHFHNYKNITIDAIIVGSLGSWDPKNDKTLLKLCSKKYLKLMKKLIVSETIRASRDIFVHHKYGQEQYDYRSRENRNRNRNWRLPVNSSPLPELDRIPSHISQNELLEFIHDQRDADIPDTNISPAIGNAPHLNHTSNSTESFLHHDENSTTVVENLIIVADLQNNINNSVDTPRDPISPPDPSQELFDDSTPVLSNYVAPPSRGLCSSVSQASMDAHVRELYMSNAPVSSSTTPSSNIIVRDGSTTVNQSSLPQSVAPPTDSQHSTLSSSVGQTQYVPDLYQGVFPSGYFNYNITYSAPPELEKVPIINVNYNSGEITHSLPPKLSFSTGSISNPVSTNPSTFLNVSHAATSTVSCNQGPISHASSSVNLFNPCVNNIISSSATSGPSSSANLGNTQLAPSNLHYVAPMFYPNYVFSNSAVNNSVNNSVNLCSSSVLPIYRNPSFATSGLNNNNNNNMFLNLAHPPSTAANGINDLFAGSVLRGRVFARCSCNACIGGPNITNGANGHENVCMSECNVTSASS